MGPNQPLSDKIDNGNGDISANNNRIKVRDTSLETCAHCLTMVFDFFKHLKKNYVRNVCKMGNKCEKTVYLTVRPVFVTKLQK